MKRFLLIPEKQVRNG